VWLHFIRPAGLSGRRAYGTAFYLYTSVKTRTSVSSWGLSRGGRVRHRRPFSSGAQRLLCTGQPRAGGDVFYLMEKVLASITHGDNGLWFLANMSSTPVVNITTPSGFFIFAFLVTMAVWSFTSIWTIRSTAPAPCDERSMKTSCSSWGTATSIFDGCLRHCEYDDGLGRLALRCLFRFRQP